jgi:Flp pilus assembly protein TadD
MRSTPTRGIALAASLALVLVVAGCGSSSKSNSTTPALTKAEFLKKGNAICKKGTQQINQAANKAFPKSKGKPSQAQMTKFATDTIIPSVQTQISGVKALGAPKGDEAKVKAIVTTAQAALDKGKRDPAILVSNKSDPFAKSNKLTKAYGLKACGGG